MLRFEKYLLKLGHKQKHVLHYRGLKENSMEWNWELKINTECQNLSNFHDWNNVNKRKNEVNSHEKISFSWWIIVYLVRQWKT